MFEKKTPVSTTVSTFLAGVVAGVVLGLLFAPMTGKKMQRRVVDVSDKMMDKLDDLQATVRKMAKV